ncbi:hypothetical protein FE73_14745, partial [Staphylococcus aureus]
MLQEFTKKNGHNLKKEIIKYESKAKGDILKKYDWIKTRSKMDENKHAVIDHEKQTSWTYKQINA